MTVPSSTSSVAYNGDNVTTVLAVPFYFLQNTDLLVQQINHNVSPPTVATLTLGTNYTVTGAGVQSGGSVTLSVAAATGYITSITRNVPVTQLTHYVPNDPFPASTHEQALDKLTMLCQQILTSLGYAVTLPASTQGTSISSIFPYPVASQLLGWDATGTFLVNTAPTALGAGTVTGGGAGGNIAAATITDYNVANNAAIGGTKLAFIAAGAHAIARTMQAKAQERTSVLDDGAIGNGTNDDGTSIANAIADYTFTRLPVGNYQNKSAAITLPFNKTLEFDPTADITTSGTGTTSLLGVSIRKGHNPSAQTGWTNNVSYSYEGLAVDFGGYGNRQFGTSGVPTAIVGAMNVPSGSTIAGAQAVAAYIKSVSASTNGVAFYGEANVGVASAGAWGINTRTIDNGFQTTMYGAEFDINATNANTTCIGISIIGGSTAGNTVNPAVKVGPMGTFANPAVTWGRAFFSDDGSALVGMELGAAKRFGDTGVSTAGSQPINMYWLNAGTRTQGATMFVDTGGDFIVQGGNGSGVLALKTYATTITPFQISGNNVGFFGQGAQGKQTVTGSKGANAALASLMAALSQYGLVQDSTT